MKIVIANWKMNPQSLREAEGIFKSIKKKILKIKETEVVICPPSIYVNKLSTLNKSNLLNLGAQDIFYQEKGSWTGKLSPKMLREIGASFVILGHSENRQLGENNEIVNLKIKLALKNRLGPIICIGEKKRDNEGDYFSFLEDQLLSALKGIGSSFSKKLVIAYEPVWAIGKASKKIIKPKDLLQIVIFIKKILADKYGIENLEKIKILYGGSVSPLNAEELIQEGGVNGFLVGRDSLIPENFNKILKIVEKQF